MQLELFEKVWANCFLISVSEQYRLNQSFLARTQDENTCAASLEKKVGRVSRPWKIVAPIIAVTIQI